MRYAIIDNSTLTAVQRVLGNIKIKNKHLIDGDILALESYIEAILFYDRIFYLDDYKEQYKHSRKQFFNGLYPLAPSDNTYKLFKNEAKKTTEDIVPCVQGGFINDDDFRSFFDLLKMNVVFTWDMSSSEYFLNTKMLEGVGGLDINKYSKLSSMIFSELADKIYVNEVDSEKFVLYDSKGNVIKDGYKLIDKRGNPKDPELSSQVRSFFASLNWLAFRTVIYTLIAKEVKAELILHPIRNAFQINLLSKLHIIDSSVYRPVLKAMNGVTVETINRIMSSTSPFILKQDLPLFTAWLAAKTGDPHKFIDAAYELREKKVFVEARRQLINLEDIFSRRDEKRFQKEANMLIREVNNTMNRLCSTYRVENSQVNPITSLISIWNVSTMASGFPTVPINQDEKVIAAIKDLFPARGFKALYRNLVNDLSMVSKLGRYHDIISSKICLDDEAIFYDSKTEDIDFLKFKSYWKIPM